MTKRRAAIQLGAAWLVGCATAAGLPAGLDAPDRGVVCDRARGVCHDRYGPSIGLTEAFLGRRAAERLSVRLRERPGEQGPGTVFSPADGVECVRESGPCRVGGTPHAALTASLYGPWLPREGSAEARAMMSGQWRWIGSRFSNDTEALTAEPERYTLRLLPDGTLRVRADCNGAGGRYRLDGSRIAIEISQSTLAACAPGSLEAVYLRDLRAAALYFLKGGRLYLDLRFDSGTMEFDRE